MTFFFFLDSLEQRWEFSKERGAKEPYIYPTMMTKDTQPKNNTRDADWHKHGQPEKEHCDNANYFDSFSQDFLFHKNDHV